MIKMYDIAKDNEWHPYLIELNSFDVDKNITVSQDGIIDLLTNYLHLNVLDAERVYLIAMDMYNRVVGIYLIGLGDYKGSDFYNRHIALALLLSGARKFIVAHNHPDGALFLSDDDNANILSFTFISQILKVDFINSYVITADGYISNGMNEPKYF